MFLFSLASSTYILLLDKNFIRYLRSDYYLRLSKISNKHPITPLLIFKTCLQTLSFKYHAKINIAFPFVFPFFLREN